MAVKKQSGQVVTTSKPDECVQLQNSDGGDTEDVLSSDSQSTSPPNSIMSLSEDEISKGNLFFSCQRASRANARLARLQRIVPREEWRIRMRKNSRSSCVRCKM